MREQLQTSEGELHRFVNVYLNDEDVRLLSWLDTEVSDGDTLLILPAMAGGGADRRPGTAPAAVSPDLVATIGETPLVELRHASPNPTSGSSPSSRATTPPARSRTARRSR